jgi:hypothetical protein
VYEMDFVENIFSELQENETDEWIVKITVKKIQGISVDDESLSSKIEFRTEYFCMLSLLLGGTSIQQAPKQTIMHWCNESVSIPVRPQFALDALRSTELCCPNLSQQMVQDENKVVDNRIIDSTQARLLPQKCASNGCPALVVWDETFAFGASHPDLCFSHETSASSDSADADIEDEQVEGHAALRPELHGQGLLLLLTVHALDSHGTITPRWQARFAASHFTRCTPPTPTRLLLVHCKRGEQSVPALSLHRACPQACAPITPGAARELHCPLRPAEPDQAGVLAMDGPEILLEYEYLRQEVTTTHACITSTAPSSPVSHGQQPSGASLWCGSTAQSKPTQSQPRRP